MGILSFFRFWEPKTLTGTLEKINLTFGEAGNQVMTIDGEEYATWIDYSKWPPIGSTVTHTPYVDTAMGRKIKATKIHS